jgi:phosphate-selective porin OprO/OprP
VQRFRGKPQSDVATPFVDTGNFLADHSWNLGFEALWADGPFSVLAEYVQAWTPSAAYQSPSLYGWYATASWVFTGTPRPYDKKAGYARRVPVAGCRWGALEIFARYGRVNLNGGTLEGGAMNQWYGGLNWFATNAGSSGSGTATPTSTASARGAGRTSFSGACSGSIDPGACYTWLSPRPATTKRG